MSLRTKFNPMGSSGVRYYTLTIITSPSDSTVTLTYNNVNYNTQSLKVEAGSIISYSIYHSTYGTKTGSIIMTSDKTITATGTSSSIETSYDWTQPKLSANGTIGGSSFSVKASSEYSSIYAAWKALDKDSSTFWQTSTSTGNFTFYNPIPLKVTSLYLSAYQATGRELTKGNIQGSNNNSTWTTIKSWSSNSALNLTINMNDNTNYYKYYKINITDTKLYNPSIRTLNITGTYLSTTFSYDWNINIT